MKNIAIFYTIIIIAALSSLFVWYGCRIEPGNGKIAVLIRKTGKPLANGGIIDVPTIAGKTKMRVPAGTQSGSIMRIKGKGSPNLRRGTRGDLHVRLVVETPVKLSKEQQELLDKFNASLSNSNTPKSENFVKEAKQFLRGDGE